MTFAGIAQMNDINTVSIKTLVTFIGVFNTHSFSEVARREGVSASNISRTIQQLEDALGQQLFYRNTRAVVPTEAGRLFLDYAQTITEQMNDARKELQDRTLEPTGLIRINAPVFFGQRHIAPWLPELSIRYPNLQIELTFTDDFIDPYRDASDVIFRIGALTDSSLHARVFGTQVYHLAASPAYLKNNPKITNPSALKNHQCLIYKGSSGGNRWLFKAKNGSWAHYPVAPLLASNNADTLLTCALKGMGLVLFPDWLIGEHLKTGTLVKVLPNYDAAIKTEPQQIAAIYPHTRYAPLNVRALIDYFADVFGEPLYWQQ